MCIRDSFKGGPLSNIDDISSNSSLFDISYSPALNLSERFSFLKYSSKASDEDIIPSEDSIDEISAADEPWGIFTIAMNSSTWLSLVTIFAVLSIEVAMLDAKEIAITTAIIVKSTAINNLFRK